MQKKNMPVSEILFLALGEAAVSLVMMILILLSLAIMNKFSDSKEDLVI